MDYLEEARQELAYASDFYHTGPRAKADWHLQKAIACVLIAITERMPQPQQWLCTNDDCNEVWQAAPLADGSARCPSCGHVGQTQGMAE